MWSDNQGNVWRQYKKVFTTPSIFSEDGKIKVVKSKDKFFKKYCNQIKNEKGFRSHSYKLKRQ